MPSTTCQLLGSVCTHLLAAFSRPAPSSRLPYLVTGMRWTERARRCAFTCRADRSKYCRKGGALPEIGLGSRSGLSATLTLDRAPFFIHILCTHMTQFRPLVCHNKIQIESHGPFSPLDYSISLQAASYYQSQSPCLLSDACLLRSTKQFVCAV